MLRCVAPNDAMRCTVYHDADRRDLVSRLGVCVRRLGAHSVRPGEKLSVAPFARLERRSPRAQLKTETVRTGNQYLGLVWNRFQISGNRYRR